MTFHKSQNYNRSVVAWELGSIDYKEAQGVFGDDGTVLYLECCVGFMLHLSKFIELYTNNSNFIVCKLYLNKPDFQKMSFEMGKKS